MPNHHALPSQVESEFPRGIGKWESLAFNVASLLGLAGFLGAQRARRNHEACPIAMLHIDSII